MRAGSSIVDAAGSARRLGIDAGNLAIGFRSFEGDTIFRRGDFFDDSADAWNRHDVAAIRSMMTPDCRLKRV